MLVWAWSWKNNIDLNKRCTNFIFWILKINELFTSKSKIRFPLRRGKTGCVNVLISGLIRLNVETEFRLILVLRINRFQPFRKWIQLAFQYLLSTSIFCLNGYLRNISFANFLLLFFYPFLAIYLRKMYIINDVCLCLMSHFRVKVSKWEVVHSWRHFIWGRGSNILWRQFTNLYGIKKNK